MILEIPQKGEIWINTLANDLREIFDKTSNAFHVNFKNKNVKRIHNFNVFYHLITESG